MATPLHAVAVCLFLQNECCLGCGDQLPDVAENEEPDDVDGDHGKLELLFGRKGPSGFQVVPSWWCWQSWCAAMVV